jgi:hypothetical protein
MLTVNDLQLENRGIWAKTRFSREKRDSSSGIQSEVRERLYGLGMQAQGLRIPTIRFAHQQIIELQKYQS